MQVTQGLHLKLQVIQDTQDASYTRPSTHVTSYTRHSRCQSHKALNSSYKLYKILKLQVTLDSQGKVRKTAKIRKRYKQVPQLTQDTTWESNKSTINITNKSQEVSTFPAGDHKAAMNSNVTQVTCYSRHSRCKLHKALNSSYKLYKTLKMQVTQGPQRKLRVIQDTQVASYAKPSTQVTSHTRHSRCQLHKALNSSYKSYKTLKMPVTQCPQLKLQVM